LPWQPILGAKSAKSAYSPLFVAGTFQKGLEYRNADGRVNSGNDLATPLETLVNFSPVTLEFTRVIGVNTPSRRSAMEFV